MNFVVGYCEGHDSLEAGLSKYELSSDASCGDWQGRCERPAGAKPHFPNQMYIDPLTLGGTVFKETAQRVESTVFATPQFYIRQ